MPLHWPGYNYLGPGTYDFSQRAINRLDEIARRHDLRYARYDTIDYLKLYYIVFNNADRQFLAEIEDDPTVPAYVSRFLFRLKRAITPYKLDEVYDLIQSYLNPEEESVLTEEVKREDNHLEMVRGGERKYPSRKRLRKTDHRQLSYIERTKVQKMIWKALHPVYAKRIIRQTTRHQLLCKTQYKSYAAPYPMLDAADYGRILTARGYEGETSTSPYLVTGTETAPTDGLEFQVKNVIQKWTFRNSGTAALKLKLHECQPRFDINYGDVGGLTVAGQNVAIVCLGTGYRNIIPPVLWNDTDADFNQGMYYVPQTDFNTYTAAEELHMRTHFPSIKNSDVFVNGFNIISTQNAKMNPGDTFRYNLHGPSFRGAKEDYYLNSEKRMDPRITRVLVIELTGGQVASSASITWAAQTGIPVAAAASQPKVSSGDVEIQILTMHSGRMFMTFKLSMKTIDFMIRRKGKRINTSSSPRSVRLHVSG